MRNFHLTHIAVNLLLIVALAIQPVAVCMANVECATGCSDTTFTCHACGCCEVEQVDDRCSCCSGPAEPNPEEPLEASCCSSQHNAAETTTKDVDEESEVAIDSVECAAGVRSICLCGLDSQPLSDSAPRRIANENRETLSLGSHNLDEDVCNRRHLLVASKYAADVPVPMHFSQVILCIWRL
jgi:hypothetical protein